MEPHPKGKGNHSHARNHRQPAQLTAALAARIHGPYADADAAGAAEVSAEAIRYLNHAALRGGITQPATVNTVAAHLATTACRLPQLLIQLAEWLAAETAAGRIADDRHRDAWQLADAARILYWRRLRSRQEGYRVDGVGDRSG